MLDVRSPFHCHTLKHVKPAQAPAIDYVEFFAGMGAVSFALSQANYRGAACRVASLLPGCMSVSRGVKSAVHVSTVCRPLARHQYRFGHGFPQPRWPVVRALVGRQRLFGLFLTMRLSLFVLSTTVVVVPVLGRSGRGLGTKQVVVDVIVSIRSCLNKTVVRAHS